LRDLPPVRIRRSECPGRESGAIGCTEQADADRIGPENSRAVDRPEPDGKRACCMYGQQRISEASQLEFRMVHCIVSWLDGLLLFRISIMTSIAGGPTMTALTSR
jgi:hypothetical protein